MKWGLRQCRRLEMAPSQSQVVTFAAGSALILGVIFTIYLVRRRSQTKKENGKDNETEAENENSSQNAAPDVQGETDSIEVPCDDDNGPPLPDKDGLSVSTSWAILNNSSENNSPHLSPVNTEDSEIEEVGEENSIQDSTTQEATVLEVSQSESTILLEKVPQASVMSTLEREVVSVEEVTVQYEELLKQHKASGSQNYTSDDIKEALMATQKPAHGLSEWNSEVLVWLLSHNDDHLKHTAVKGIANCATFTKNQNILREKGCLPKLAKLLEIQRMAMWLRHSSAPTAISSTLNAATNLAVNEQNNQAMQDCVPTLVDITLDKETGESVCLSSLQALTNLSVTPIHHGQYTRLVQRLYEFLENSSNGIRLQTLKILINLSCNPDMVPHLLAAKAPDRMLDYLQPSLTSESIVLRFLTLLANMLQVVKDKNIESSSLPAPDKAASPETMYTALLGVNLKGNLKNKTFLLCKHTNVDIKNMAARVYNCLT